jgi:hypothetical protein
MAMTKKLVIILLLTTFATALFYVTLLQSQLHNSGFNRAIRTTSIPEIGSYKFQPDKDSVRYLISVTDSNAFFITQNSAKLFVVNRFSHKKTNLNISDTAFFYNIPKGNFCIAGDGNNFYFFRINANNYLHLNLKDNSLSECPMPPFAFTKCALSTVHSIIFRRYNSTIKDQEFCVMNLPGTCIRVEQGISERNQDWGMKTDGMLLYDNDNKLNIYVYYKKNSYLVMDSNLRLINTGKTIDSHTITVQQTMARIYDKKNKVDIVTDAAPSRISVIAAAAYKGRLYICSTVKADNEERNNFNENSVIDVYRVKDIKYLGSFYLPRFNREQLRSFIIFKDRLFAAYESGLKVAALPEMIN